MKTERISAKLKKLFIEDGIYDLWMEHSSEGIILCDKGKYFILYLNQQCLEILSLDSSPKYLNEIFNSEEVDNILNVRKNILKFNQRILEINCLNTGEYFLLIIKDMTKITIDEKRAKEIEQLNKELQMIYEQYADDTIFITNGQGIVEFAGKAVSENCGASPGYMIGKSVYDLEAEKYFYPSVTVSVLESKQTEVTIQTTKIGKTLVAVGTPIFDEKGRITKVISITRDYTRQIKIGTLLSKVRDEKHAIEDYNNHNKDIITCNDKMLNILSLAKLVAMVNSTVLITGETGTGKEVVARYIHNSSTRALKPFIKVNCGAISPSLVESELFGYEPGSFTGANKEGKTGLIEAANGGTLFLDEISELPLTQQVKLLQVLQERSMTRVGGIQNIKLDIRIIAATNKVLENQVAKGEFREDLFYRLNVVPINLPPLREREEDIPLLIKYFLKTSANGIDKEFTKQAFTLMCKYSWPGNIRELFNTVERLIITSKDMFIDVDDLPEKIRGNEVKMNEPIKVGCIMKLEDAIEELEKQLIKMAVDKYGTGKKAGEALGVNQSTVSRKMEYYKIKKSRH